VEGLFWWIVAFVVAVLAAKNGKGNIAEVGAVVATGIALISAGVVWYAVSVRMRMAAERRAAKRRVEEQEAKVRAARQAAKDAEQAALQRRIEENAQRERELLRAEEVKAAKKPGRDALKKGALVGALDDFARKAGAA
jgi:type VI protein secretion system component VasK